MRWFVILLLSLLGVAMGYFTLLHVSLRMEQLAWLVVFIISSFFIFRFAEGRHFLHGLVLGFIDCALCSCVHLAYYKTYLHSHPEIALINSRLEPGMSPYAALAIIDATKSLFYALTSGIFAVVMSAGIKKLYDR